MPSPRAMTTLVHPDPIGDAAARRARWARVGAWCIGVSLAWNLAEGVVAVWAGEASRSIALVGFGLDSFVETASAAVIAWRLWAERHNDAGRASRAEKVAGRWMGALLVLLAGYITVESVRRLVGVGAEAQESIPGLVLTAVSLVVMPVLFLLKRRVARELNSAAVRADGVQTLACVWLSVATFTGLALNAALGWSWADPVAGLVLIPFIIKEARAAWKGEGCGCSAGHCSTPPGA